MLANTTLTYESLSNVDLAPTDAYSDIFDITKKVTGLYMMPFITIFGIIGNIFIVIVYQKSQPKLSTNIYLIVLSLSDILKLLNDFLYFIVNLMQKIDESLSEKIFSELYLYSHYVFVVTGINTAWLTCAIAIDRYITVSNNRPKSQLQSNYRKAILVSCGLLATSAVISVPSPLFLSTVDIFDPSANKTVFIIIETRLNKSQFRVIYNYMTALIRACIPLCLLIYLNFRILRIVYKNKIKKKPSTSTTTITRKRKSKSSVTLMLLTIILSFVICMFPDAILTMLQFGYANESSYLIKSIREVTDLLLTINSAITFPICAYFSIEFRSKIERLLFRSTSASNRGEKSTPLIMTRSSRGSPRLCLKLNAFESKQDISRSRGDMNTGDNHLLNVNYKSFLFNDANTSSPNKTDSTDETLSMKIRSKEI